MSEDQPDSPCAGDTNKFNSLLADYYAAAERTHMSVDAAGVLAQFFTDLPISAYIKSVQSDGSLKMTWVNKAYERELGLTSAEFNFVLDKLETTSPAFLAMQANDELVTKYARAVSVKERGRSFVTGKMMDWIGWKWPVIVKGEVVAVCGYAFPEEIVDADG